MAVLEAYDNIVSHLDKGEHTAGIFLDLSKSFDMISHDILLTKLHHYSVRGNALDWLRDYLGTGAKFGLSFGLTTCGRPQLKLLLLLLLFYDLGLRPISGASRRKLQPDLAPTP